MTPLTAFLDFYWWRVGLGLLAWLAVGLVVGHVFGRWVKANRPEWTKEE